MSEAIATFGEVMLRLSPAEDGRLMQALPGSLRATFGGAEANVSAALAMLGAKTRFLSALPENAVAEACLAQLRGLCVQVDHVLLKPTGRMGIYYTETGSNQRSSQVIYDREHSVLADCRPDEFDFPTMLTGVEHLHVSGITPALSESSFQTTLNLLQTAQEMGITISIDLNFRNKLWRWYPNMTPRELAGQCMTQLVAMADIIIGNEEDAADVFGIVSEGSQTEQGKLNVAGYEHVARELCERFPKCSWVACTLRESLSANHNKWGGMLFQKSTGTMFLAPLNDDGHYAPYPIQHIVDRFGGGDSFCAGLIYALSRKCSFSPHEALRFAVAFSCLKHSVPGDYNYVTETEVKQLMDGCGSGRVRR